MESRETIKGSLTKRAVVEVVQELHDNASEQLSVLVSAIADVAIKHGCSREILVQGVGQVYDIAKEKAA